VADKSARIRLSADSRGLAQGLREATKKMAAFGKGVGKGLGSGLTLGASKGLQGLAKMLGGKGMAGKMLGGLQTAVGLGGIGGMTYLVGNEAAKTLKFEQALTRLGIASMGTVRNLDALRQKAFAISNATGVAREDVLAGASAYVTLTGDARTAIGTMELFSKVSKGTGASMEDIAGSAAAMKQNLKIDPKDFEQAFSVLIRGGKMGAVELKDMAAFMSGLSPRMAIFKGGLGVEGLAELGAAFQLTRQGFGDAGEAATGMESLMGSIVQHASKLKTIGVDVYGKRDPKTKRRELKGLMEIVEKIGGSKAFKRGDWTKIQDVLGRKEAVQTLRMLLKVPGAVDEIARATLNAKDVSEDYETYQQSQSGRLEAAWNRTKNAIATTFTPDRIETFARALELAAGFAGALADALVRLDAWHKSDTVTMPGGQEETDFWKTTSDEDLGKARDSYGPYAASAQRELERRAHAEMMAESRQREYEKGGGAPATGPVVAFDMEREALGDEINAPGPGSGVTTDYQYTDPTVRGDGRAAPVPGRYSPSDAPGGYTFVPDAPEVNVTIGPQGWFANLFQVHLDNAPARRKRRRHR
jgi:TP901 family phage tail tape measure protein